MSLQKRTKAKLSLMTNLETLTNRKISEGATVEDVREVLSDAAHEYATSEAA